MTLLEFKKHIESFPSGTIFSHGISHPFSWRGSYCEVAFSISSEQTSKDVVLKNIEKAYSEVFLGYKGGEYTFNDDTVVNFEQGYGAYSDGRYTSDLIAKIENSHPYNTQESRLAALAFTI